MASRKEPPTTGTSSVSAIIPSLLFNQFGDCEGATLRSGNVSSADGWQELLEPVVKGYQKKGLRLLFRGDAAFAKPELYEYLEEEKTGYAIRLPANQVVQEQIQPLLASYRMAIPGAYGLLSRFCLPGPELAFTPTSGG